MNKKRMYKNLLKKNKLYARRTGLGSWSWASSRDWSLSSVWFGFQDFVSGVLTKIKIPRLNYLRLTFIVCGVFAAVFVFLIVRSFTKPDTEGDIAGQSISSGSLISEISQAVEPDGPARDETLPPDEAEAPPAEDDTAIAYTTPETVPEEAVEVIAEPEAGPVSYGNTTGNISNTGHAATDGEWIYYRSNDGGSLYKMKPDGSESSKLSSDNARYINVLDGWVYYKNWDDRESLYKIRTNGEEKTKLNDEQSNSINVAGGYVYYSGGYDTATGKFGALYKIALDGTGREQLTDDWCGYVCVQDDWVYYSNESDGFSIYKIRTDGTERQKVNDEASNFLNIAGDFIYYGGDNGNGRKVFNLYKIRTDGTQRTLLSKEYAMFINVSGDWIFYSRSLKDLVKIRTDGTQLTNMDCVAKDISIAGDWLFHNYDSKNDGGFYKIKTDGTERQKTD